MSDVVDCERGLGKVAAKRCARSFAVATGLVEAHGEKPVNADDCDHCPYGRKRYEAGVGLHKPRAEPQRQVVQVGAVAPEEPETSPAQELGWAGKCESCGRGTKPPGKKGRAPRRCRSCSGGSPGREAQAVGSVAIVKVDPPESLDPLVEVVTDVLSDHKELMRRNGEHRRRLLDELKQLLARVAELRKALDELSAATKKRRR